MVGAGINAARLEIRSMEGEDDVVSSSGTYSMNEISISLYECTIQC